MEYIYTMKDTIPIKDDSVIIPLNVNVKHNFKVSIDNNEKRMAKDIEIGFIFPSQFLIELPSTYSIFRQEDSQIIRYNTSSIQAKTNLFLEELPVTPLEQGNYTLKTFIKGENIESTYRDVVINVNLV